MALRVQDVPLTLSFSPGDVSAPWDTLWFAVKERSCVILRVIISAVRGDKRGRLGDCEGSCPSPGQELLPRATEGRMKPVDLRTDRHLETRTSLSLATDVSFRLQLSLHTHTIEDCAQKEENTCVSIFMSLTLTEGLGDEWLQCNAAIVTLGRIAQASV
jgi:hypothetical protein